MNTKQEKGQAIVKVTHQALESLLSSRSTTLKSNLPPDARFLSLYVDDISWAYNFKFESKEWEPLEEGEEIPKFDMVMEVQENGFGEVKDTITLDGPYYKRGREDGR